MRMNDKKTNRPDCEKIACGIRIIDYKIEKRGDEFSISWDSNENTWTFRFKVSKIQRKREWVRLSVYWVPAEDSDGPLKFTTEAAAVAYAQKTWGDSGNRIQDWH